MSRLSKHLHKWKRVVVLVIAALLLAICVFSSYAYFSVAEPYFLAIVVASATGAGSCWLIYVALWGSRKQINKTIETIDKSISAGKDI